MRPEFFIFYKVHCSDQNAKQHVIKSRIVFFKKLFSFLKQSGDNMSSKIFDVLCELKSARQVQTSAVHTVVWPVLAFAHDKKREKNLRTEQRFD